MKFLFDENMGERLARGFQGFGEEVEYITDHFEMGTPDEEIIEFMGENGYCWVTKDKKARYKPQERRAIKDYGVGAFILVSGNLSSWEVVKQMVARWEEIKEIAKNENRPFIWKIRSRGKLIKMDLT